jgi:ATP/maltotriose-dependent transcriptional regulator MalT
MVSVETASMKVLDARLQTDIPARAGLMDAAASLVGCIGTDDFAEGVLHRLHHLMPLGAWTVFRMTDEGSPTLELSATFGQRNVPTDCWRIYRTGLYRSDRSFDEARRLGAAQRIALCRVHAAQLSQAHQERIYADHRLRPRMSLILSEAPGKLLALNLYRFVEQPGFDESDAQVAASLAPVLLALVQRHLALAHGAVVADADVRTELAALDRLREMCPRLTQRELEVCAALLKGWTFDGIAAHLDVSAATVKTYRDRAFRRLGIHHRNQLFGLCATPRQVGSGSTVDAALP